MYFEVYLLATEFRRRILATAAAPHFSGFFLIVRTKEIATKEQLKRSLIR
jgi:hypothetical protein